MSRRGENPSPTRRAPLIGALGALALAVAPLAAQPATASDTASGAVPDRAAGSPVNIAYVEVNNDDLANVGKYSLADGSPVYDVAIIFAANVHGDSSGAHLYFNDRVQATLDDAVDQIRPLQARGIKVSLSILGDHQGVGISNFASADAAGAFASEVADAVNRYGLDGVDLDDEYADYGANGTSQPNDDSARWLVSALRAQLPDKLVTFYDIGPASDSLRTADASVGSQLDYAWNPYYGTYSAPSIPGLPASRISAAAVDIQSTSEATAADLAQRTEDDGYGVFMTYNLPGGDRSGYLSSFTRILDGSETTYSG